MLQLKDLKGYQFLKLCDRDNNPLEPSYAKGSTWLKYFGHSNSLCARATKAIVNHAPIGEYRMRFFSREDLAVHIVTIPLKQGIILFMSVEDITNIGI